MSIATFVVAKTSISTTFMIHLINNAINNFTQTIPRMFSKIEW